MLEAQASDASNLDPGFYRHANDATVYRVADGAVCTVLSESQLKAFRVTDKSVRVVDDSIDFSSGMAKTPTCLWPEGYYHIRGTTYILRVEGASVCALPSTDDRVLEIGSTDIVTAGRKFTGRCSP